MIVQCPFCKREFSVPPSFIFKNGVMCHSVVFDPFACGTVFNMNTGKVRDVNGSVYLTMADI